MKDKNKKPFDWVFFWMIMGVVIPALLFVVFMIVFTFYLAPEIVKWRYGLP